MVHQQKPSYRTIITVNNNNNNNHRHRDPSTYIPTTKVSIQQQSNMNTTGIPLRNVRASISIQQQQQQQQGQRRRWCYNILYNNTMLLHSRSIICCLLIVIITCTIILLLYNDNHNIDWNNNHNFKSINRFIYYYKKEQQSSDNNTKQITTTTTSNNNENNNKNSDNINDNNNIINRCYDTDDPIEWLTTIPQKQQQYCICPDPTIPTCEYRKNQPIWMEHHIRYINDINYEITYQKEYNNHNQNQNDSKFIPLDILFLGDSIIERWNGTRSMGQQQQYQEYRTIAFDPIFNRRLYPDNTASLQGLLLGSSGDITMELLWHLQNGILRPNILQPKIFFIMIGTNDLGRMECSKITTLYGIISILLYISSQYPKTPIIVHGLLPRSDTYNQQNYTLGRYYNNNIVYINQELDRACQKRTNWYYMNFNSIFLTNENTINSTLMSDSLHPDILGYQLWGQLIAEEVLKII